MAKEKLTVVMRDACQLAAQHGGKLQRAPGGFWAQPGWKGTNSGRWFGTPTIQALVSRGVAEYTDWQQRSSGNGRFPIEVTVNIPASDEGGI